MARFGLLSLAPFHVPFARRLQTLAVLHYVYAFLYLPVICFVVPIGLLCTRYWWLTAMYFVWFCYDFRTPSRGSRAKDWFRRLIIWEYFRDYFPISLVKTVDLDPNRNYIFGYHPHGVVSVGCFINFGTEATGFSKVFPGIKAFPCTLGGQFWFPFRREYIGFTGAISVSRQSIRYVLSQSNKGHAVIIVVGGAIEAIEAQPGCHDLVLSRRKGFIKLALENGADLVPTFSFGENDLFLQLDNPEGSFLRNVQVRLKRFMGVTPPLFKGRGVFNYNFGVIPYRKPVTTVGKRDIPTGVFGKPVIVEKRISHPTQDDIDRLHSRYCDALTQLFEEHKENYDIPDDVHLKFI